MNQNKITYFFQNADIDGTPLYNLYNKKQWFVYRQARAAKEIEMKVLRCVGWMDRSGLSNILIKLKMI